MNPTKNLTMNKIIAMIPARIGSKRVPKKNLRYLNGKPLITYSIEAAKNSGVFDEIYINSDADIFGEIAEQYGVSFYKRPNNLGTDSTNNDAFAFDFINNVNGDILIQLLPTSPLIKTEEISGFVAKMLEQEYDTLISVLSHQIACIYNNKTVNFKLLEPHISSQDMIPVQSYATVLMGWTYLSFQNNMKKFGFAYHGADSKIGYYPLKGLSKIDIDNEEDFVLAEVALQYKNNIKNFEKKYYESKK
jgi:CMP-N-acetylneuraminic acid synthetase